MIATGRQIREGRKLVGWSQADLAAAADIALGLVVRVEQTDWLPMITKRDASAIREALEAAGVIFVEMSGEGHGVQVRKMEG